MKPRIKLFVVIVVPDSFKHQHDRHAWDCPNEAAQSQFFFFPFNIMICGSYLRERFPYIFLIVLVKGGKI